MGRDRPGDRVGSVTILHRLPEANWLVRRLGGGLPAGTNQPQRPQKARPAGYGAVRPSPLPLLWHSIGCADGTLASIAYITALRCDPVNPPLFGMRKVLSEDLVRRGLAKIDEAKGLPWLQNHLDYCISPLLGEPWILDMDSTVKTLYGHQEGAEAGYNPHKPGRPSHAYHTYMLSSLRLVLRVDVLPGDEYNVAHATDGLWARLAKGSVRRSLMEWPDEGLLDHLGPARRPSLLRGDKSWGIERVMARAEQNDLKYLFRLRMTLNVKRDLERAMRQSDWTAFRGVSSPGVRAR
jgi:hypothetical protein